MRTSTGGWRRLGTSPLLIWGVWLASRPLALSALLTLRDGAQGSPLGDLGRYWAWASRTDPTATLDEYPGLAQQMIAALAFVDSPGVYLVTWILTMLAVDAVILAAVRCRGVGSAWMWVAGPPLLGPVAWLRLDMLVALGVAVTLSQRVSRPAVAAVSLGLTALTKVWAIALVPALAVGTRWRTWTTSFALVVGFGVALEWWLRTDAALKPFQWQLERGMHVESVLATPAWVGSLLGSPAESEEAFRSFQLTESPTWLPLVALAALMGFTVWLSARLLATAASADIGLAGTQIVTVATLCVAVVATNKVFSPQYVLWFLPAISLALAHVRRSRAVVVLTLLTCVLTQAVFPYLYGDLLAARAPGAVALVLRNLVLIGLLGILTVEAVGRTLPVAGLVQAGRSDQRQDS